MEKSNWLKLEIKKFRARLHNSMNAASIQSEKMKEEIIQLNKKLDKSYILQDRLSRTQKQLSLIK